MIVSVLCDMGKDSIKDTFFEMNKFPKEEPVNFCKPYDNEGTFQLLLQYLITRTSMVVNVPCDTGKDQGTFFKMNKFSTKEPVSFCKFCDSEGATQLFLLSNHFVSSTV